MEAEEIDKRIAEELGWRNFYGSGGGLYGIKPAGQLDYVPTYTTRYDAILPAIQKLLNKPHKLMRFEAQLQKRLCEVGKHNNWEVPAYLYVTASPRDLAMALVRTLDLLEEEP